MHIDVFLYGNPNLRSILKPAVTLLVFLHMRSNKITKNTENTLYMPFERPISHVFIIFRHGNPNLRSILTPEVVIVVFLRTRSDKITKNAPKKLL